MIGVVQTFGDLVHWHPHVHNIVAEGIFTESGHFVHIPAIWKQSAGSPWFTRTRYGLPEKMSNDLGCFN